MAQFSSDGSLTFIRGDDVRIPMTFKAGGVPADLTGYLFKAQIRTKPNGYVVLEFDIDDTNLASGEIVISAAHDTTELIRVTDAWWDLQQTVGGVVDTIIGPAPVFIVKDISL